MEDETKDVGLEKRLEGIIEDLSDRVSRLEEGKRLHKEDFITLMLALISSAASIINAAAKFTGHQ